MRERIDLKGKTVKIKSGVRHFQFPDFGGSEIRIEDYWDTLTGKSWGESEGNPGCMVYGMRVGLYGLPFDDEVVYGKRDDGFGSLVHISELELE